MELGITGRTALVLGAGGGLGSSVAEALAAEGASVAIADRASDPLQETLARLKQYDVKTLPLVWDLAALDTIDQHVSTIEDQLGPVEILVAITGGPPPTPASGQDTGVWASNFESMVLPVIALTDRILPSMRARKWGRILTSTSSGVIAPIPNLGISNALRMSLVGWSKTLANEVGADGVTANVVVPGRIATQRITFLDEAKAEREGRSVEEVAAQSTGAIPMRRYGHPTEYADAIAFLASDRASYITGSIVRVDGGMLPNV